VATSSSGALEVHPLTPERWGDLERLFGPSGGYSNCWCSFQRVTGREYAAGCENRGAGNRALLRRLTDEGRRPGLIGYRDGVPVGWVSVGPRTEFGRMLRSPVLKLSREEAADASVWSIVCFFLPRANRGRGIGPELLEAAVAFARAAGARAVEGYPVDTRGRRVDSGSVFTGTLEMFARAGFATVHERVPGRPMVRLAL
jgi:GNAT superfamily N-acetyltransferase